MLSGQSVALNINSDGIATLNLDSAGSSVNVLNSQLLDEIAQAVQVLQETDEVRGLILRSAKAAFVLGADIKEFPAIFDLTQSEVVDWALKTHGLFNDLESLPFPTVALVNGMALGGGLELALSCDYRVCDTEARIGLPEVTLGICPGWGGTVRLPRLIGTEAALGWMLSGKPQSAQTAAELGAVNRVVAVDEMEAAALELLLSNDYEKRRKAKQQPSKIDPSHHARITESFKDQLDPDYPAASRILETVLAVSGESFDKAQLAEAQLFAELASGNVAKSLVGLFISDQFVKRTTKNWSSSARPVEQAAVLGAGIMGGGIAYQSALKGTPILMKDINQAALDLGMRTADSILERAIKKGRMDYAGKAATLQRISPQLDFESFDHTDCVVEAVVERLDVKTSVLKEVEQLIPEHAVLASNTSTISINQLAKDLQRPEQFCGMHFFNPVNVMALVEVIRGDKTSDETIATTVAYAAKIGKTPIVVRDCPGFLVNRVLFPYFNAFNRLLMDGVDFQRIDRVMEKFGWPMGPAYLADVIGLDTMVHADMVLQEGFPERMLHDHQPILERLLNQGDLGQKNGRGFYIYGKDENGRRTKDPSPDVQKFVDESLLRHLELSDQDIIDRMMIPMCLETARCVDEGIVDSAAEADMGLILGLGFPRFRGGALRYIDNTGLQNFAECVESHGASGPLYQLSEEFKARVVENRRFYSE